ncbi:MAG: hypothetical protein MMC33_008768 [Icmadophila ericetorum]|nr:hypothetical protein [Icmadophila ericetorum]
MNIYFLTNASSLAEWYDPRPILLDKALHSFPDSILSKFIVTSVLTDAVKQSTSDAWTFGYNTSQALIALPLFMPSPEQARLRYMVIFFGANDACLPSSSTGQHVPLQRYKENLKAIVEHPLIQKQQPRLILITPPPINEYQLQADLALVGVTEVQRTAEHTAKYAYACREVGESLRIPVLDLWSTFIERAGWQKGESLPGSKVVANNEFLSAALLDALSGLHLTPVGYRCLFDDIMILIRKTYPEKASGQLDVLTQRHWPVTLQVFLCRPSIDFGRCTSSGNPASKVRLHNHSNRHYNILIRTSLERKSSKSTYSISRINISPSTATFSILQLALWLRESLSPWLPISQSIAAIIGWWKGVAACVKGEGEEFRRGSAKRSLQRNK